MDKEKEKRAPYYNIGQLRVDYWNNLKIETSDLTRCHKGSANEKAHKQKVKDLIKEDVNTNGSNKDSLNN